jgi:hypothetical protein
LPPSPWSSRTGVNQGRAQTAVVVVGLLAANPSCDADHAAADRQWPPCRASPFPSSSDPAQIPRLAAVPPSRGDRSTSHSGDTRTSI